VREALPRIVKYSTKEQRFHRIWQQRLYSVEVVIIHSHILNDYPRTSLGKCMIRKAQGSSIKVIYTFCWQQNQYRYYGHVSYFVAENNLQKTLFEPP
jgi:hypothetical protein